MNNVVLIGMPSSGKSTVGVLLAKFLGYGFIDSDLVIQSMEGKLLAELISERGAEGFLEIEERVNCALNVSRCVIATGGSAVYSDAAMQRFKEGGAVVYLKTDAETVKKRIPDLSSRGVVMRGNVSSVDELLSEREPLYEKYADITVLCGEKPLDALAEEIAAEIRKREQ